MPSPTLYYSRDNGAHWTQGFPESTQFGMAGIFRVWAVAPSLPYGTVRGQDLTTGYSQIFNLDGNGENDDWAIAFTTVTGIHNIRVTFSNGYIKNYTINVY